MKRVKKCYATAWVAHNKSLLMIKESLIMKPTENMQVQFDTLQYVFACLSTHSQWVKKIIINVDEISKWFQLTRHDEQLLRLFFKKQGKPFWISTLIAEEKRWRELLPNIKYIASVISITSLKAYWQKYLDSFCLKDKIPTSPIFEAIEFLKYILKQPIEYYLIKEFAGYELIWNMTVAYEFKPPDVKEVPKIKITKINLALHHAVINPSVINKQFKLEISKLIKQSQQDIPIKEDDTKPYSNEHLTFYKEIGTGTVRCLQLAPLVHTSILQLKNYHHLQDWIINIMKQHHIDQTACIRFLEKLSSIGLVSMVKVN